MVAGSRDPCQPLTFVVLQQVVPHFMHQHIEQHEPLERIAGPPNEDGVAIQCLDLAPCSSEAIQVLVGYAPETPGSGELVKEDDTPGNDESSQAKPLTGRPLPQLDRLQTIDGLLTEETQNPRHVGLRGRVVVTRAGSTLDDPRKRPRPIILVSS